MTSKADLRIRNNLPGERGVPYRRPVIAVAWLSQIAGREALTLRRSEFEQRVALSFGEVVLWRVVNANPVSAQEGDGWSYARAEQPGQQVQLAVRFERTPKDGCRLLG